MSHELRTVGLLSALAFALPASAGTNTTAAPNATTPGMRVVSSSFHAGNILPDSATCHGAGRSPPLEIQSPPNGTRSFAIIVQDLDAPNGRFIHWTAWNVPPRAHVIPDGAGNGAAHGLRSMEQGRNDFGRIGYGGACPPHGLHHYQFKVFALDSTLDLARGATATQLSNAMLGHILAEATLIGEYAG